MTLEHPGHPQATAQSFNQSILSNSSPIMPSLSSTVMTPGVGGVHAQHHNQAVLMNQQINNLSAGTSGEVCWDQATTLTGTSGGTSSLENGFSGNNQVRFINCNFWLGQFSELLTASPAENIFFS